MRDHDDPGLSPAAPAHTSRAARAPDPGLLRAAAAGRADVLGAAGLLRLQRLVGNEATEELVGDQPRSPVLDVVGGGGGRPLDADLRQDMESRMGADFGDVRIHTGTAAADSARAVGAHAYTVGSDIVFQRDRYDPSSTAGRTMLAHELTHVVQQRSGPVDGTDTGDGLRVSDPSDRFERAATANAEAVLAGAAPHPGEGAPGGDVTVQRAEGDEEEDELGP